MQQPELGRRLVALRKEKNLTQEELTEKSHVSVRTIQRIEAGEVMPRLSTVKILLQALGQDYHTFVQQNPHPMPINSNLPKDQPTTLLLVAIFAGALYLATDIALNALDLAWLTRDRNWAPWLNYTYIGLTLTMMVAYAFFMCGFIVLSNVFENGLLKIGSLLMMFVVFATGVLDITTLYAESEATLWLPYVSASILFGALSLVFGIGLLRLQDGMGEISRIAGMLEIVVGVAFVTVFLFFIGYVVTIPAIIVELLVLYKGYEYLSKKPVGEVKVEVV